MGGAGFDSRGDGWIGVLLRCGSGPEDPAIVALVGGCGPGLRETLRGSTSRHAQSAADTGQGILDLGEGARRRRGSSRARPGSTSS